MGDFGDRQMPGAWIGEHLSSPVEPLFEYVPGGAHPGWSEDTAEVPRGHADRLGDPPRAQPGVGKMAGDAEPPPCRRERTDEVQHGGLGADRVGAAPPRDTFGQNRLQSRSPDTSSVAHCAVNTSRGCSPAADAWERGTRTDRAAASVSSVCAPLGFSVCGRREPTPTRWAPHISRVGDQRRAAGRSHSEGPRAVPWFGPPALFTSSAQVAAPARMVTAYTHCSLHQLITPGFGLFFIGPVAHPSRAVR